jgi:putative transposase
VLYASAVGTLGRRDRRGASGGDVMTGEEVRPVLESMRPQDEVDRLCQQCGVIERQRQLDLGMLVRAMVISAGTPGGAYQADVLRSYLEFEVPRVARSAFYRGFDEPLERFMEALAARALAYARAQQVDLVGPLWGVTDWYIVESTTVKVRDPWREDCPGTGDDAAITIHTVLSVSCGAPVQDHVSPARAHASRHLEVNESWRGYGLLADRASASLARLRAGDAHAVPCVIRLKDHWQPKVAYIARGQVTQACWPGTDRDTLLLEETLRLDGRVIDADGPVGQRTQALALRLVGVQTPKGYGFFRTHLPPHSGPRQVADPSRVRWEVALSMKLDTSVHRLDAIDAERPCSLKALLHASLIASILAALLAHTHHLNTRPQQDGAPRTEAPLHPRRLALQLAVSCQSIAQAFDLQGEEAMRRWDQIAALLTHGGRDPNWRRRPSVLDQLRGWKRQPLPRKKGRGGAVSHGHIKAAA